MYVFKIFFFYCGQMNSQIAKHHCGWFPYVSVNRVKHCQRVIVMQCLGVLEGCERPRIQLNLRLL